VAERKPKKTEKKKPAPRVVAKEKKTRATSGWGKEKKAYTGVSRYQSVGVGGKIFSPEGKKKRGGVGIWHLVGEEREIMTRAFWRKVRIQHRD